MYFEGSEKKFELVTQGAAFRSRPEAFWHHVVGLAGAKVLSRIGDEACAAYLLSESSLFVWDDRVIMITCGRTSLVTAAEFLLSETGAPDFFTYERKIEYYPHQQATDFLHDVRVLSRWVRGRALRFGAPDEHHLLLFHMDRPYAAPGADCTLEILMYNLQGPAAEIFSGNQTLARVRQLTAMDQIFPGFAMDDHLFQPHGYSLNAIRGSEYYTLHVTPEETGSYVSFETNFGLGDRVTAAVRAVVEVFQPRSFDVVYFHPESRLSPVDVPPFLQLNHVRQSLNCGYEVGFTTHCRRLEGAQTAVTLEL